MTSGHDLEWIESGGGPLLLLPTSLLSSWEGADALTGPRSIEAQSRWKDSGPATDYDRACDLKSEIGVLAVGSGYGLVLGDEPLPTTWKREAGEAGGVLVRWVSAEGDDDVVEALESIAAVSFSEPVLVIEFCDNQLYLFDAALSGESGRT